MTWLYLHLVDVYRKCGETYHSWIVWVRGCWSRGFPSSNLLEQRRMNWLVLPSNIQEKSHVSHLFCTRKIGMLKKRSCGLLRNLVTTSRFFFRGYFLPHEFQGREGKSPPNITQLPHNSIQLLSKPSGTGTIRLSPPFFAAKTGWRLSYSIPFGF